MIYQFYSISPPFVKGVMVINVSGILQLVKITDFLVDTGFMPIPWNDGMLEYWNNVLKTYNFSVWIKVFGVNFQSQYPVTCIKYPVYLLISWLLCISLND